MKQTILSILLTLLPIMVSADAVVIEGIYYNLEKEKKEAMVTKNPDKYKGNVKIPAYVTYEGLKYNVRYIEDFAFNYCSDLTSVIIPSSITSIGASAFEGCTNLNSIEIPSNVTSIGNKAFASCTNLTSAVISSNLTSISENLFNFCINLKSIVIPKNVTSIGVSAFQNCISLRSIDIPQSVTNIDALKCLNFTNYFAYFHF